MSLSEEQKQRMEENRKRALELLARKKVQDAKPKCQHYETCRSEGIDQVIFDVFGELVCSVCKLHDPSYALINRAEANSVYLVTDDALKTIKFQTRDNPHHSSWTPMKLFLRKHVIELSVKRFGSLEKMEEVKKERESVRYEKSLEKTSDLLVSSTKLLWDTLDGDNSNNSNNNNSNNSTSNNDSNIDCNGTVSAADKSDRKRPAGQEPAVKKIKKSAINSLVNIIKGTSND